MEIETTAAGETIGRAKLSGALGGDSDGQTGIRTVQSRATVLLKQHPTGCIGIAHG